MAEDNKQIAITPLGALMLPLIAVKVDIDRYELSGRSIGQSAEDFFMWTTVYPMGNNNAAIECMARFRRTGLTTFDEFVTWRSSALAKLQNALNGAN